MSWKKRHLYVLKGAEVSPALAGTYLEKLWTVSLFLSRYTCHWLRTMDNVSSVLQTLLVGRNVISLAAPSYRQPGTWMCENAPGNQRREIQLNWSSPTEEEPEAEAVEAMVRISFIPRAGPAGGIPCYAPLLAGRNNRSTRPLAETEKDWLLFILLLFNQTRIGAAIECEYDDEDTCY